ncbi:hypothetical protein DVH24_020834 [Malus domestica]|uniref:Uncharacterized protein n=1 Tax=Malus domestica TaxID=3750 RepID=A0A498JEM3_MALDO|nr:hypothetical protein DVH24_020834 [Malus domestica]
MGEERRHIVSNGRIFGGATLNGRDGTPVLGFPFSHHIKASKRLAGPTAILTWRSRIGELLLLYPPSTLSSLPKFKPA